MCLAETKREGELTLEMIFHKNASLKCLLTSYTLILYVVKFVPYPI